MVFRLGPTSGVDLEESHFMDNMLGIAGARRLTRTVTGKKEERLSVLLMLSLSRHMKSWVQNLFSTTWLNKGEIK